MGERGGIDKGGEMLKKESRGYERESHLELKWKMTTRG